MSQMNLRLCILVAAVGGMLAIAAADDANPSAQRADGQQPAKVSTRPSGLASEAEENKRLEELEAIGRQIEERRGRDWAFPHSILQVCSDQASLGRKGAYLARVRATRVLEKTDDLPLNVHWSLVSFAGRNVDSEGNPMKGEAKAELRKQTAISMLEAWRRLEKTIDKNWDPEDPDVVYVMPPGGGPPGMSPEAIADPKLRAEYEAAIKANLEKIARHVQQIYARRMREHDVPRAKRSLIWWYMEEPDRVDELQALLDKYLADVVDAASRAEIVQAVKNKKVPESLEIRHITTRPTPAPTAAPTSQPG